MQPPITVADKLDISKLVKSVNVSGIIYWFWSLVKLANCAVLITLFCVNVKLESSKVVKELNWAVLNFCILDSDKLLIWYVVNAIIWLVFIIFNCRVVILLICDTNKVAIWYDDKVDINVVFIAIILLFVIAPNWDVNNTCISAVSKYLIWSEVNARISDVDKFLTCSVVSCEIW